MKILITGGAGFIGSHLAEHYQGRAEVLILDNFITGSRANLTGLECTVIEGSILDRKLLERSLVGVDYVFHLAALVSVPESMTRVMDTITINNHGLITVLEAAKKAGVKKVCFASSAAVYGENPVQPAVETLTPDPRSPYGITKLDGEYYCALYAREGWVETAALRFFNVFGPRQNPDGAYAAAVPIFIRKALAGAPLTIYGDGEQTRDFIYVKDIVSALAFLAERPGATGVFNAGYGGSMSIKDLAQTILDLAHSTSPLRHVAERPGDIRHSRASAQKLMALGWQAQHGVVKGLHETVSSFVA